MNITTIVLAALLIALGGFGVGHRVGKDGAEVRAQNEMSEHLLEDDNLREEARMRAAASSSNIAEQVNTAAQAAYTRGMNDAEVKRSTVIADLRSGNERLRSVWQGCKAGPAAGDVSFVAGTATEPFGDTSDREEGAGDLVRVGAQADAQASGLIEAYNAAKTRIDEYNKQSGGSSRR